MSAAIRQELVAAPSSPSRARSMVRRALATWGLADDARVAELLTSELVTNAVLYAATEIMVTISCRDSTVRVEISDKGMELPALVEVPDTGGYGLRLVDRLSSRWGVEQVPGIGKSVWFELDVDGPVDVPQGGNGSSTRGRP